MRKGHGDALGRGEAVFAIKNHAVAAIEEDDSGAGRLILALVNHEIAILHVDGNFSALAANGVGKCGADIEIQDIAEFVGARNTAGLDSGRKIASIVAAETAAAQ